MSNVNLQECSVDEVRGVWDKDGNLIGVMGTGKGAGRVIGVGQFGRGPQSNAARVVAKFRASRLTMGMMRIFGDSYANDQGASVPALGWTALLWSKFGSYFTGKGVVAVPANTVGAYIVNASNGDYYNNIGSDDVFLGFTGFNDTRTYDLSDDAFMNQNKQAIAAAWAYLAVPNKYRVPLRNPDNRAAGNPALTFTGTWNHARGGGRESVGSLNATVSYTPAWEWDTMYIHAKMATGSTGAMVVRVGGVDVATFYTTGKYAQAVLGWEPVLFRVKVPRGTQDARITVTTDTIMLTDLQFFSAQDVDGPLVINLEYPPLTDAGYAVGSTVGTVVNAKPLDPAQVVAPSAGTADWKPKTLYGLGGRRRHINAMREVVEVLQGDGLNVISLPTGDQMDPTKHVGPDLVHMGDQGHQLTANSASGPLALMF